jgi:L-iditol 2-dehydrogenase
MRALHYSDWNTLEIADLPDPVPAEDEVIIDVAACGICGSELETFASRSERRTPPLVMGHEFCGTVTTGDSDEFPPGSRVVCNAIIHCGECPACASGMTHLCWNRTIFGMHRQGAFAERVAAPLSCLLPWPENLPAHRACLAEPLGNGVHVAERIRDQRPGSVLVIGAGSIGLMVIQAVRALLGVPVCVVDVIPERLAAARSVGAIEAVASTPDNLDHLVAAHTDGLGFDAVVDAAGTGATKRLSMEYCRDDCLAVWIGLGDNEVELATYPVTLREQTITGSYGATVGDLVTALMLMEERTVDVDSWTTQYSLDDSVDAFLRQIDPSRRDIKAIINVMER